MSTITITLTGEPSRSKQAGPRWIALTHPTTGAATYAARTARSIDVEDGGTVEVAAKVTLRRSRGSDVTRRQWTIEATGDAADTISLSAGSPQAVEVTFAGARLVES